jgi:hypothetical protein
MVGGGVAGFFIGRLTSSPEKLVVEIPDSIPLPISVPIAHSLFNSELCES